jgi:hypothetical protein
MQVVLSIAEERKSGGKQAHAPVSTEDALEKLRQMPPPPPAVAEELKEWTMNTPAYKALREASKAEDNAKNRTKQRKTGAGKKVS